MMPGPDAVAKILQALGKRGSTPDQTEKPKPGRKYAHTLSWYAEHYGKSLRTVKRWAAEGLPLDDDALMREHMADPNRQAGRKPVEEPATAPVFTPADPTAEEPAPVQLDESFFAGSGVLAAVERLKMAERERSAAYFDAIKRRQPAQIIANRFKEWTGLIDFLRKLEKDVPEIRRANGSAIDKAETEAAIGQVFQAFKAAGNNMPGRAARKVVGLTEYDEVVEILTAEWETVCRALVDVTLDAVAMAERQAQQAEEDARREQAEHRQREAAE
ncbi:hypothetical protein ACXR0O_19115 [Verrucomicrobiota bacterium sgz303538]